MKTKDILVTAGVLALLFIGGAIGYKIVTFSFRPLPKVEPKKPKADCTARVEVGDLWADPLRLKCGRSGDTEGKARSCLRILFAPGFENVRTCWDPATIGQVVSP